MRVEKIPTVVLVANVLLWLPPRFRVFPLGAQLLGVEEAPLHRPLLGHVAFAPFRVLQQLLAAGAGAKLVRGAQCLPVLVPLVRHLLLDALLVHPFATPDRPQVERQRFVLHALVPPRAVALVAVVRLVAFAVPPVRGLLAARH